MKSALVSLAAAVMVAAGALPACAQLKDGTPAPEFKLDAAVGGDVSTFDLKAALAKGPVVVYFYPKSFTSGCTIEAHTFSENIAKFKALGATVIGISSDDIATQKKFSTQECHANFPIASDPGLKVAGLYDAKITDQYANRTSYVIAPDGTIVESFTDMEPVPHITNALKALAALKK